MSRQISVYGAVEVLHDRGLGMHPRWYVGSGFLFGGTQVLTAAHNVGEGQIFVRVEGGTEYAATTLLVGNVEGLDLAIVKVNDSTFCNVSDQNLQFAVLNRDHPIALERCWAIGFPRFKEKIVPHSGRAKLRDTHHILGVIPLRSNLVSGTLELLVTATPRPWSPTDSKSRAKASPTSEHSDDASEWDGISGAVVFAKDDEYRDCAIGVITQYHPPEGQSSLIAVPITDINTLDAATVREWWKQLGVPDPHELPRLPTRLEIDLVAGETTYRECVVETYKSLNFRGFVRFDWQLKIIDKTDILLDEIFVRTRLTQEEAVRDSVPPEMLSEAEQRGGVPRERVKVVPKPIELGHALDAHLLIMGAPGAGKSTLLRWLAVIFADRKQRDPDCLGPSADADRLPILVELGKVDSHLQIPKSRETSQWTQYLHKHLKEGAFPNVSEEMLAEAFRKGRCLLLFDGLDEIADRQRRIHVASSIANLACSSHKNRVVIGSRPQGIRESKAELERSFPHVCQIEDFALEDIRQFSHFWYALDTGLSTQEQLDYANTFIDHIQNNSAILELATTPLLCTNLLLIWRNEGYLPQRRIDLYERCCNELVGQWENAHDVHIQGDTEQHLCLLAQIAYFLYHKKERTEISEKDLSKWHNELPENQKSASWNSESFLKFLNLRSPLLRYQETVQEEERYSFLHQTFQEYLAARYIAEQPDPEYIDLVMEHLHESWWEEVHLITIAHLGPKPDKASKLILTILQLYRPPSWILRPSHSQRLCLIEPGKLLPQIQLERRIAWALAREFELAAMAYLECRPDGVIPRVETAIAAQAESLVQHLIFDAADAHERNILWPLTYLVLQRQGREAKLVSVLCEALHDANLFVRIRAAKSLGWMRAADNEVAVRVLQDTLLSDDDSAVRWQAAASLQEMGVSNEAIVSAVNALQKALYDDHDDDTDTLSSKKRTLWEFQVNIQLEELRHTNWYAQYSAAEGLGQVEAGNEAVMIKVLQSALSDPDVDFRREAVEGLGLMGVGNEAVVNALIERLRQDTDADVQMQAATGLGQVGVGNEAVADALQNALINPHVGIRRQAAAALGRVRVSNKVVVNSLITRLREDTDADVRCNTVQSLEQVEVDNEEIVNALIERLRQDTDADVRYTALQSLERMRVGNKAMVNALQNVLSDPDVRIRIQAAAELGKVGAGNESVAKTLIDRLDKEDDTTVRYKVVRSLEQVEVNNEEIMNALIDRLDKEDDTSVRRQVAAILGRVGVDNERVADALRNTSSDPDIGVRRQAVESLGWVRVGNEVIVHVLIKRLRQDTDADVRYIVAKSLGSLDIKDTIQLRRVLVALNRCLHDRDNSMRRAALISIRQLLHGRPIPGYQWVPLRKRQLMRIAFWLFVTVFVLLISLVITWLNGILDTNGFLVRFVIVLTGIITFIAAVAQVLGRALRDPWDHS